MTATSPRRPRRFRSDALNLLAEPDAVACLRRVLTHIRAVACLCDGLGDDLPGDPAAERALGAGMAPVLRAVTAAGYTLALAADTIDQHL